MPIRTYEPGDEESQAVIYNTVARSLPGFKPSTPAEIARRYHAGDPEPGARFFATEGDAVVGYATFSANGRISYPWCLRGAESYREPLLEAVLSTMRARGHAEAWAAYRADWLPALEFFEDRGFVRTRSMMNYIAEVARLPAPTPLPSDRVIEPFRSDDIAALRALAPSLFAGTSDGELLQFFESQPHYQLAEAMQVLRERATGRVKGAYVLVVDEHFADPTKIDPAMPCFRLGAFGTERQRHKRISGMFSCICADQFEGDLLLSEALKSLAAHPHVTHLASQAPSDVMAVWQWYDRHFSSQGSFPILGRPLTPS